MGRYTAADLLSVVETLDGDLDLESLQLDTLQGFARDLDIRLSDNAMKSKSSVCRALRYRISRMNKTGG